jgi:hypothetical protein
MKSGSLNLLEHPGLVEGCTGIALLFKMKIMYVYDSISVNSS